MQTRREWADEMPGQADADDAPVPLHILHAQQSRAQRDRMLLLLFAFFAVAVAATLV
jgi:hypothetical protein